MAKRTKQGLNIGTEDIRWLEDYSIYDAKVLQLAVLGSQLGMVGRFQVMHGEEVSKKKGFSTSTKPGYKERLQRH